MKNRQQAVKGFTLLEILVAMTILIVIILIVSGVFHQSRTAWEMGIRKTDLNMEGRAALNLMAQELAQAVADGPHGYFTNLLASGGAKIDFWTFGNATNGERVVRHIWYDGSSGTRVDRQCQFVDPSAAKYPTTPVSVGWVPLAESANGVTLKFLTDNSSTYRTNLPAWIDIELGLSKGSKYSIVKVSSDGPDGIQGTKDDINNSDARL